MGSTFAGLSTALSSLYAQRRALDTTGQNIANANTEGYSRQRVDMKAASGTPVPALYSTYDGAGAGVSVSAVLRLRDTFLESRGRAEHAQASFLAAKKEVYGRIEHVFAEPSDTALASQLADFWAGWGDVANQPNNDAVRTQLIERGATVVDGLHAAYDGLNSQWDTMRVQLNAYATDVNTAADAIAHLNQTIMQQQAAGLPTNELADQRDLHLMQLAELTGATTVSRDDGTVDVFIGGSSLVAKSVARHIEPAGASNMANQPGSPVQFRWESATGPTVAMSGGRLAADLDTLNTVLPGYGDDLNEVARQLAATVNGLHDDGFDSNGAAGGRFFQNSTDPTDDAGITARNIQLTFTDPKKIAASGTAGAVEGSNAVKLAGQATKSGGPDSAYRALVVGLGVAAQAAQRRSDIQDKVAADMDVLRSADAGVNLDEEMTNMIAFQRAYEAASRVLNAVDETLDVLINRTGLVGR